MLTMRLRLFLLAMCLLWTGGAAAQNKGKVLEEIVARVNSEAITRGDLERSRTQEADAVRQSCSNCTPAQLQERFATVEKDLLRDLIDSSLLVQRGKDLGINVDTDVI